MNGDGEIDARELAPLLVALGVISHSGDEESLDELARSTALEMDQLMAEMEMVEIDADDNGACSFDEVCRWWRRCGHQMPAALSRIQATVRGSQARRQVEGLRRRGP